MPTVPRAESRVRESGLPNVRVSQDAPIEAFGGGASAAGVTQAVGNLSKGIESIALQEKKNADDLVTQEAAKQASMARNRLMYDSKEGAYRKQGKDAFGVVDEYNPKYQAELDKIEAGLVNEDQKQIFRRVRISESAALNNELYRHSFTEAKKFDQEETESGLAVARDDAVLNYQTPGMVNRAIDIQKALINSQAQRNGLSAEWVKIKTMDVESKTKVAVMNRMLANGNDQMAKAYYDDNKATLTGSDQASMEKTMEEGIRRGEAIRQSDKIFATAQDMPAALEEARKIQDPKLRDDVTHRLKEGYSLKKLAEQQADEARSQYAGNIIDQTKGDIDKIPPNIWKDFSVSQKSALRSYAASVKKGEQVGTKWDAYYGLQQMASTPSLQNDFVKTNLMDYRDQLGDAEFKELTRLQGGLRNGDSGVAKELDGIQSDNQILNSALSSAGINPNPKPGTEDADKVAQFRRRVDQDVAALQARTGKKASNAEVQLVVDNLMVEGITQKGWIWDDKKRAFQIQSGESVEFAVGDIPRAERIKIEKALSNANMPISDQKILELYTRKQLRSVNAPK